MKPDSPVDRLLPYACAIAVAVAVIACLPSLAIPIGLFAEGDALDYRIPLLKWFLKHRSYPNLPWTFVDDYPLLGELLMLPFFAVKAELARVVPILAYFGAAWGAALVGAELSARREHRLFFFACVLGFQPLLVQACHVMVDNVANAFAIFTLYFTLRGRAVAAGCFLAAALATRYSMWGVAPAAVLAWLAANPRRLRGACTIAAIGALGAAPFAIRNVAVNHNPFYPLLDGYFNGFPFTTFGGWGRGTDLLSMLLFPFDLFYTHTFVNEIFDTKTMPEGWYTYRLGFFTYVQLAASLAALWVSRADLPARLRAVGANPEWRAFAVFWAVIFLFWWNGSLIIRYFGHGLTLLDVAILYPAATRLPRAPRAALAALAILPVALVQGESWRIFLGKQESFRASAYAQSADACFARAAVPAGAVMGWSSRDALNGYYDYDWVFFPPNNIYRVPPGTPDPRPDFIYSGIDFHPVPGYKPWPEQKPCLLRRAD